jgi:hypothetical protein
MKGKIKMRLYQIDIFNKITGKNEPDSGIYEGNLEDIIPRLTFSAKPIDIQIKISSINVKKIDMNRPKNNISFDCNDNHIDLFFAKHFTNNSYEC